MNGAATTSSPATVLAGGGGELSSTCNNNSNSSSSSFSSKKKLRCPSLFMFMFRSRRNALLKQLWRRAAVRHSLRDADSATQPGEDVLLLSSSSSSSEDTAAPDRRQHSSSSNNNVGSSWIKSAAHALFKRLTDDQLSLLLDAVEGGPQGADTSPCLPLPSDALAAVNSTCIIIFFYFNVL